MLHSGNSCGSWNPTNRNAAGSLTGVDSDDAVDLNGFVRVVDPDEATADRVVNHVVWNTGKILLPPTFHAFLQSMARPGRPSA